SNLPSYSIRVRSNGVTKQFGGKKFHDFGILLAEHLIKYAFLSKKSNVLEIGCGCGRTAFALSEILEDGNFTGVDIEKKTLHSCRRNSLFIKKNFTLTN
ncbi:MAG: methyltransferase domain-containing protein, partial [Candidatus Electrothrix sp. AUS1_2]|nr:methyltransferase domain-containing protein [Candidatus Electrothrix sp. AUS1_2]